MSIIKMDNWNILDTKKNELRWNNWKIIKLKPSSRKVQKQAQKYWDVMTGEKSYQEAFPNLT